MDRDIWTIVFNDNDELFLLKNQIISLIKFENTLSYNVIINETRSRETRLKMENLGIYDLLDKAPFKTCVYDAGDFLNKNEMHKSQGYINQQILKLQVYKKSPHIQHIILDAKDIACKKKPLEKFHPKRHLRRPNNFFGAYEHFMKKWYPDAKCIPVRPPSTPYLFKKQILKDLEESFGSREEYIEELKGYYVPKTKFFRKLDKQINPDLQVQCISEFFIYNLYEQKVDHFYKEFTGSPIMHMQWLTCTEDDEKELGDASFISLHRKRVKVLGQEAAQKLIDSKIK